MRTRPTAANLSLLLAALAVPAVSQSQANYTYQNRGRYSEGAGIELSTGRAGLDLIAALVDYEEPAPALPPKFRALFYLPGQGDVDLTIREIKPLYFYRLDKVKPDPAWRVSATNRFEWPTATVIQGLKWKTEPLTLSRLGATVRIGPSPGDVERVAPVALYHTRPPSSVDGYRFVFRPSSQMRLRFQVFRGETNSLQAKPQEFLSVLADQPHEVLWKAQDWQDGWYRLVVSGYTLSSNARIDKIVRFYHARGIGN